MAICYNHFQSEIVAGMETSALSQALLSAQDRTAIRDQVHRIATSPLFSHSKRYPALLRYIVDRALEGTPEDLKERTLGTEVFGREPAYDTNADPVVRIAAGEIRKRLAQYYQQNGHAAEIRIDLPPGSYVPEFRIPAENPVPAASAPPAMVEPRTIRARRPWLVYKILLALAALVVLGVAGARLWPARTTLDRFWRPVLEDSRTALICVGQRPFIAVSTESPSDPSDLPRFSGPQTDPSAPLSISKMNYLGSRNVALPDVIALGNLAGLLGRKGKLYRIRGERSTTFADLRDGPVILIGSFSNEWTMRLMGPGRFSFERDHDTLRIRDRQNPSRNDREINRNLPYQQLTKDYAVISRVLDPTTGQMVVVAAGLTGFGTMAAGEFLTDSSYMAALSSRVSNWEQRSLQILIETRVIHGVSGPPRILDVYSW